MMPHDHDRRINSLPICLTNDHCESSFNGTNRQIVSDSQACRQFGNAVVVPLAAALVSGVVDLLERCPAARPFVDLSFPRGHLPLVSGGTSATPGDEFPFGGRHLPDTTPKPFTAASLPRPAAILAASAGGGNRRTTPNHKGVSDMKGNEFLQTLGARLTAETLAEGSVERVLMDAKAYAAWYAEAQGRELTVAGLASTDGDLLDYHAHLQGKGMASPTIVRKFASLRKVFSLLAPERLLQVRWPKVDRVRSAAPAGFTEEQRGAIERAIRQLSPRDAAICTLLLTTGARAGALAMAKLSGLTLSERGGSIRYEGRKGEEYEVPLGPETCDALERWLRERPSSPEDRIFLSERFPHEPINRGVVWSVWHDRLREVLPPEVAETIRGPQQARHDLGRSLISGRDGKVAPAPVARVAALLGHTDARTTASLYGESGPGAAD